MFTNVLKYGIPDFLRFNLLIFLINGNNRKSRECAKKRGRVSSENNDNSNATNFNRIPVYVPSSKDRRYPN